MKKLIQQSKFDKNYYFGKVYSNYDQFLDWKKISQDLIKRFEFNSFLDIGCGCGNLVKEIKKSKKIKADVWGIDKSVFAIRKAKAPFVILADCQKLPFKDNCFDMVHILGTFSYLSTLKEIRQAIKEAYRVSKKIILFDDVYVEPDKENDNYDPYRQKIFSFEEWFSLWKKALKKTDMIEIFKDEIIIKKYAT